MTPHIQEKVPLYEIKAASFLPVFPKCELIQTLVS